MKRATKNKPQQSSANTSSLAQYLEQLPFPRCVRRVFLMFQILAQHHRFSEGRDELTTEDVAERLRMPHAIAVDAVQLLADANCLEVASTSPARTAWRFIPDAQLPTDVAVQTSALAK